MLAALGLLGMTWGLVRSRSVKFRPRSGSRWMAVSVTICAAPVRPLLISGLVTATTVSSWSVTTCCLSSKSWT